MQRLSEERQQFPIDRKTAEVIAPLMQQPTPQDQRIDIALNRQSALQQRPLITDG